MKTAALFLCAAALLSGGCATAVQHRSATTAAQFGAPAHVTEKMNRGQSLGLTDLEALGRNHVPEATVIAYLRQTGDSYRLTTAQIDRLQAAEVSPGVIDYLLTTPNRVSQRVRGYSGGGHYRRGGYGYRSYPGIRHRPGRH